ncbi:MAG: hypothetical protein ACRYHA_25230 [Janthinobacterium lividum]
MFLYPGSATPFGPFPADLARTRAPATTPATAAADPLPTRRPAHTRAVTNAPARADDIERTLVQARAVGVEQGWSLDECGAPTAAAHASTDTSTDTSADALAEGRLAYLATIAPPNTWWGAGPRPLSRNPWRACEMPRVEEPLLAFEPLPGWRWQLAHGPWMQPESQRTGARPRPLWLADEPRDPFPVQVWPLPAHCMMRVVPGDDVPGDDVADGPLLLRIGGRWGEPAGNRAIEPCSALRRYAVAPPEPEIDDVIRAGDRAWSRAADGWRPMPAPAAATHSRSGRDLAAGQPLPFDALLARLDDALPLRVGDNVQYLSIRDARGRFWLRAAPTSARAVQVADDRTARCLPARFVNEAGMGQGRWRQLAFQSAAPTRCPANAPADRTFASPNEGPVAPGRIVARGFADIAARLSGRRRCNPLWAAALAERRLRDAVRDLARLAVAREALGPMLDAWPASLRDGVRGRIHATLQDVWREAARFRLGEGRGLALVDTLSNGTWFLGTSEIAYLAPAVAAVPESALAHRLVNWFVSRTGARTTVFAPLPDTAALLARAGRFSAYDPTLMQEMLAWPDRAMVLDSISGIGPTWIDAAALEIALAVPRRADLFSDDGSDNLSIALHDHATVAAIVDALHAARRRRDAPSGPLGGTSTTVPP